MSEERQAGGAARSGGDAARGAVAEPTFEDTVLPGNSDEVKQIARGLRAKLLELFPGAVEWIDPGNGLGAYGTARRMSEMLFAIIPHRTHVNLQFADGAELDDADGLVEGTGKRIRHVKFRSLEDVERPRVRRLIEEQVARRR